MAKKVYEVSRNEVNMLLIGLKAIARPDAFLMGKVIRWLEGNLKEFNTPMVRVTIEGLGIKE